MDKPRIAQVLGVEVGETFSIDGYPTDYGMVQVCEDGKIRRVISSVEFPFAKDGEVGHKIGSNVLYYLLNHPDRIIRKPRWTQQEVSLATVLMEFRRTDTTTIGKQVNGPLWWRAESGEHGILPNELFPSILPGQSYTLDDIIGGAK